jgi:hypothetical protein
VVGLEALRKGDLFEGLSDDELAAIARMARRDLRYWGGHFRENEIEEPLHRPQEAVAI